jgi:microcystin-dependent protein
MSDPYLGEIRNFAFNFAPVGWLQCQGQILPINSNQALFALLGTIYGGNGTTTFGIPDLRGRVPVGVGAGANLANIVQGEIGGQNAVAITIPNLPPHTHIATFTPTGGGGAPTVNVNIQGSSSTGTATTPNGNYLSGSVNTATGHATPVLLPLYSPAPASQTALGNIAGVSATISGGGGITGGAVTNASTGSGTPLPTQPPFIGANYCIATEGIFPSRQ